MLYVTQVSTHYLFSLLLRDLCTLLLVRLLQAGIVFGGVCLSVCLSVRSVSLSAQNLEKY